MPGERDLVRRHRLRQAEWIRHGLRPGVKVSPAAAEGGTVPVVGGVWYPSPQTGCLLPSVGAGLFDQRLVCSFCDNAATLVWHDV